jgi:hypothetical protein
MQNVKSQGNHLSIPYGESVPTVGNHHHHQVAGGERNPYLQAPELAAAGEAGEAAESHKEEEEAAAAAAAAARVTTSPHRKFHQHAPPPLLQPWDLGGGGDGSPWRVALGVWFGASDEVLAAALAHLASSAWRQVVKTTASQQQRGDAY